MDFSKILVVPKLSKYEWDKRRYRLTGRQLISKYADEGIDVKRILDSHERQKESLRVLRKLLRRAHFISQDQITRSLANQAELVIALGGDNHFQYVSHFVEESVMMGINSDPLTSEGSLTSLDVQAFPLIIPLLKKDRFRVEEWTRIQVTLNGDRISSLAVSEVFLGELLRSNMSRHRIVWENRMEEQKCSGLLVATGAGSTGWYDAASRYLFPRGNHFEKARRCIKFICTEPYMGRLSRLSCLHGTVSNGESLKIISRNDSNGVLMIDSQEQYDFHEGSTALLALGVPLKVLGLS